MVVKFELFIIYPGGIANSPNPPLPQMHCIIKWCLPVSSNVIFKMFSCVFEPECRTSKCHFTLGALLWCYVVVSIMWYRKFLPQENDVLHNTQLISLFRLCFRSWCFFRFVFDALQSLHLYFIGPVCTCNLYFFLNILEQ
ncbi:unnamed protein product [Aphis gossypii]|uniref:Uncharacterized protein n=1 Tax=Aphis gossypii TaxID=80765 RepID=A0A9P0NJF0_APHGO|nr:unnamed protein product [Aphis gossypii]